MLSRRKATGVRFLVNAWSLQLEYVRVLHEILFVLVLIYGNETMIWKENRGL